MGEGSREQLTLHVLPAVCMRHRPQARPVQAQALPPAAASSITTQHNNSSAPATARTAAALSSADASVINCVPRDLNAVAAAAAERCKSAYLCYDIVRCCRVRNEDLQAVMVVLMLEVITVVIAALVVLMLHWTRCKAGVGREAGGCT